MDQCEHAGNVDIPNTAVPNERVIVTSEHCLHMKPHQTYGSFQAVPDHQQPEELSACVSAYRRIDKVAEYLSMPDPRQCYGRSPIGGFGRIGLDRPTLQGKHGGEGCCRREAAFACIRRLAKAGHGIGRTL